MKIGFLYAGQGSQHPGMGADLYEAFPAFRAVYDAPELSFDLKEVCFSDPNGLLNQTQYTQPCMVAFASGVTAVLQEKGVLPDVVAGLSLGEYSALHAANVFDAKTAIELAAYRGAAMAEAAENIESAMVAVMGLERKPLQQVCEAASVKGMIVIANYNCPGQLVIGGEKAAVEEAVRLAKAAGAKWCMPLKVSGSFHTPLMALAGKKLQERFETMAFGDMRVPVVFNCLGDVKSEEDSISGLLVRQVQSSVYMEDSIRTMAALGVDVIVEIGPGKVLSGFVRKTVPEVPVYAVETISDIDRLLEVLA